MLRLLIVVLIYKGVIGVSGADSDRCIHAASQTSIKQGETQRIGDFFYKCELRLNGDVRLSGFACADKTGLPNPVGNARVFERKEGKFRCVENRITGAVELEAVECREMSGYGKFYQIGEEFVVGESDYAVRINCTTKGPVVSGCANAQGNLKTLRSRPWFEPRNPDRPEIGYLKKCVRSDDGSSVFIAKKYCKYRDMILAPGCHFKVPGNSTRFDYEYFVCIGRKEGQMVTSVELVPHKYEKENMPNECRLLDPDFSIGYDEY